jgi:hypothetical protein
VRCKKRKSFRRTQSIETSVDHGATNPAEVKEERKERRERKGALDLHSVILGALVEH